MKNARQSIYQNIWVVQYIEDIPVRAFNNWYCKNINTSAATREIKSFSDYEKMQTIYSSMVGIGESAKAVQQKGESSVFAQIKSQAAELIPCGEELASVVTDHINTLDEWMDFIFVTPDICLDKE